MSKIWFIGVLLVGLLLASGKSEETLLLDQVLSAHERNIANIQTLSAEVRFKFDSGTLSAEHLGVYKRNSRSIRMTEGKQGERVVDILTSDGTSRQVSRSWSQSKIAYGLYLRPANKPVAKCDVFRGLMIELFDPTSSLMRSAPDFFRNPAFKTKATSVQLEGRNCVRLDCDLLPNSPGMGVVSYWLDPEYGGMLVKMVGVDKSGTTPVKEEAILSGFTLYEPGGVWLPSECLRKTIVKEKVMDTTTFQIAKVQVNKPILDGEFSLPSIPSSSKLHDEITGKMVDVNSDWTPIRTGVPLKPSIQLSPSIPTTPQPKDVTQEESREWVEYATIVSVAVFCLSLTVGTVLYSRSKRTAT